MFHPKRDLTFHSIRVLEGQEADSPEIGYRSVGRSGIHQPSPNGLQSLFVLDLESEMIDVAPFPICIEPFS